jgi:hypothetical protein
MKQVIGNYQIELSGTLITIMKGGQMIKAIEANVWEAVEVYNKVVEGARLYGK